MTLTPPSEAQAEKIIRERFRKYQEGKHSMSGKAFENEIRASLNKMGGWLYRPFDGKSFYAISPNLQAPKQPGDFLFLKNGVFYAFECKSYRQSAHSYPLMDLIPIHQIESLTAIEKNGGKAYFLICNRHKRNHLACYVETPSTISQMREYLTDIKKRSISWAELEKNGGILERDIKEQTWKMEVLIK